MENTYLTRVSRLLTLPGPTQSTLRVCRLVHRGENCALSIQVVPLGGTLPENTPEDELYTYPKLPSSFAHASRVQRGVTGVSKSMALVSCPQGVALLELPQVEDAGRREYLKSAIVAPALLSWGMFPALDIKWHPLSCSHFLTLSGDGVRVWNAEKLLHHGVDEHHKGGLEYELLFPWMGVHTSPPISFTFGDIGRGWEGLSTFIACQSGSLLCICPLLPPGASITSETVNMLKSSSPNALASQWLADNFTGGAGGSLTYCPQQSPDRHPLPALQGPIQVLEGGRTDPQSISSFTCDSFVFPSHLSPLHTVVGLLKADGKFSTLLSPEPVIPCWVSSMDEGPQMFTRGVVSSEPMVLVPFGASSDYQEFGTPWVTINAWDFALGDPVKDAVGRLRRKAGTFVGGQGEDGTGKREHIGGRVVEPEIMGLPWLMCAGSESSPLSPFSTSSSLLLVVHSGGVVTTPLKAHSVSRFSSYLSNPSDISLCLEVSPSFVPLELVLPSSFADVVGVELLSEHSQSLLLWLVDKWGWAGRKGINVTGRIAYSSLPISRALVSSVPLSHKSSSVGRNDAEISSFFDLLWVSAPEESKGPSKIVYDDLMASALSLGRCPSLDGVSFPSFTSCNDTEIRQLSALLLSDVESDGNTSVALSRAINERLALCEKAFQVFTSQHTALLSRLKLLLDGAEMATVRAEVARRKSESEARLKRLHTLLFDLATMHCALVDKRGQIARHGALGAATLAEELAFKELFALHQATQSRCREDGGALFDLERRTQVLTFASGDQSECDESALQGVRTILLQIRDELRG